MHHKRTTANHALTLIRIGIQASRAHKQLERELGYRCNESLSTAVDLIIKVMGV